jgi:hypothetical protein
VPIHCGQFTVANSLWPIHCGQFTVGKKYYGSESLRGTAVAAIFYSLIVSAKLCGINPHQYSLEATKRLLRDPEDILLPHQMMAF